MDLFKHTSPVAPGAPTGNDYVKQFDCAINESVSACCAVPFFLPQSGCGPACSTDTRPTPQCTHCCSSPSTHPLAAALTTCHLTHPPRVLVLGLQCQRYNECGTYAPFKEVNKPVMQVRRPAAAHPPALRTAILTYAHSDKASLPDLFGTPVLLTQTVPCCRRSIPAPSRSPHSPAQSAPTRCVNTAV